MSAPTGPRPGRRLKLSPPAPAFPRMAVELSEHIASLGAEQVAAVLRVEVTDLAAMLEGRVKPPTHKMQRLRELRNGERAP